MLLVGRYVGRYGLRIIIRYAGRLHSRECPLDPAPLSAQLRQPPLERARLLEVYM